MKRFLAGAAALALVTASGTGEAAVVTFDGGVLTTSVSQPVGTYIQNGLRFDFYGEAPTFIDDNHGGHAIKIHLNNDILISRVGGGAFSLDSFTFLGGGDTYFRGFHGSVGDVGFFLSGLEATVHPVASDPRWGDITSVDWCGYCISGFNPDNAIDNVSFSVRQNLSAAPEPAGWALMILGFGGVGAVLRRRRPWAVGSPLARG